MKAISLKQPWASLLFTPNKSTGKIEGLKSIETRTWATKHRGPLLICTSQKPDIYYNPIPELKGICRVCGCTNDHACINNFGDACSWKNQDNDICSECYDITGKAIGIVNLVDCRPMELTDRLEACINFSPELYAWELENPVQLLTPFSVKGQLKIFDVNHPEGIFQTTETFSLMEI